MTGQSADMNVRMAKAAVDALHDLPDQQKEAVARAIRRIGTYEGTPLKLPGGDGTPYLAMIPDGDRTPVVIYQQRRGGEYLVTGLLERNAYNTYTRAADPVFFDTPAGKAVLGLAGLAAIAAGVVIGRSGKPPST